MQCFVASDVRYEHLGRTQLIDGVSRQELTLHSTSIELRTCERCAWVDKWWSSASVFSPCDLLAALTICSSLCQQMYRLMSTSLTGDATKQVRLLQFWNNRYRHVLLEVLRKIPKLISHSGCNGSRYLNLSLDSFDILQDLIVTMKHWLNIKTSKMSPHREKRGSDAGMLVPCRLIITRWHVGFTHQHIVSRSFSSAVQY